MTLPSGAKAGAEGDLTSTRDYNSYVALMDEIADMKYTNTSPYVRPGRIADIGCAVGSWLKRACRDFPGSEFYGIDIAQVLLDACHKRQDNGEFSGCDIRFIRADAAKQKIFPDSSMSTIHSSSLTHEIYSYRGLDALLGFIANNYSALLPGAVWLNPDVVGPSEADAIVYMRLNMEDGRNWDYSRQFRPENRDKFKRYLDGLSTWSRFLRFAHDFRQEEGYHLDYEVEKIGRQDYIRLSLRDACEFMSKKDYTNNWQSEMHETFCYWDFPRWQQTMEQAGFRVLPASRAYTNPWIVDNRLRGKVELYKLQNNRLAQLDYPVTNMLMVAEK
jgi:SAM-dependent methyltransferase